MGIFDDFGIDPDEIKESSFDIPDGTYRFEISMAEQLDGTDNKPDTTFFIIDYELEDEDGDPAGQTRSWYTLAEDGDSETKRVAQSMSFLKTDLKRLGVTDFANFDGSELVGLTGTLQLKSTPGKGANRDRMFQNVRNVRVDEAEEAPAPKKAPAKKAPAKKADTSAEDAETKKRVQAKQAARKAAEEAEDAGDGDDEDNPFG